MNSTHITVPELALMAGTRAALGAGLALLFADRLSEEQRKAVGWTLFAVGAITTVPLAFEVFGRNRSTPALESKSDGATGDLAFGFQERAALRNDFVPA